MISAPVDRDRDMLRARIMAFVGHASIEVTPRDAPLLARLRERMPGGTVVYVAHPKSATLADVLRVAVAARALGFKACPHLCARELRSHAQLMETLAALRAGGIDRILLVAGDRARPAGPFASSLQVIDTGATLDFGIRHVGFAAHPEGNRAIGPTLLWDALRAKQQFAHETDTDVHLVTQFGFNPLAVLEWERLCLERSITLPLHVGLAGPAPLARLLAYAMQFGIGASLRALIRNASPMKAALGLATTPDAMILGLLGAAGGSATTRAVRPHFFSFGGCLETAAWIDTVRHGRFALQGDNAGFALSRPVPDPYDA